MEIGFRWDFAYEILPTLIRATGNTILAAGIGYLIAVLVGLVFLMGQKTSSRILNMITREIVEFIRSTPLLIQLFFVYFVLPQFGITLSAWVCGMLTIGLHFGTYLCEVYRGALEAVPKAQWEACRALNFLMPMPLEELYCHKHFQSLFLAWGTISWVFLKIRPCFQPSEWPSCFTPQRPLAVIIIDI